MSRQGISANCPPPQIYLRLLPWLKWRTPPKGGTFWWEM